MTRFKTWLQKIGEWFKPQPKLHPKDQEEVGSLNVRFHPDYKPPEE